MKELKNLEDLLAHEIQVLYDGEKMLLAGLKKMAKKATNPELKEVFEMHLEESKQHVERLELAAKRLKVSPDGDSNPSMKGLIAEGEKVMHKDVNPETLDATLIAAAQKIEHYEISGYGTAAHYAEELGFHEVAGILRQTLSEEQAADTKLNDLAKTKINIKAEHPAEK